MTLHFTVAVIIAALMNSCGFLNKGKPADSAWSVRVAQSFVAMHPDTILYEDEAKSRKWNYEQGLMLEAFYQMWRHTGDTSYFQYFRKNLDHYVREDGSIATYKLEDFNLDNISPGKALLRMYRLTRNNKYMRAAETLRRQLDRQPRTKSGGFWHKKIYPFQMWLDGLYMAEPFYTEYSKMKGDSAAFDDIAKQFLLIGKNSRDAATGLYFHGWDESRTQRWADPSTGLSPNLWGRSIGWMCMALVDVLESFPERHGKREDLLRMLKNLAESVWNARDADTNLWYQVVDRRGDHGNYLEASASAMFTYALAKGARLGYLPAEFKERARMSFEGIVKHLMTIDDGVVHLHQVCKVSGLGGDPYRDGSYEYYVGEPRRTDDFKGYGPLLLAAIELEKK